MHCFFPSLNSISDYISISVEPTPRVIPAKETPKPYATRFGRQIKSPTKGAFTLREQKAAEEQELLSSIRHDPATAYNSSPKKSPKKKAKTATTPAAESSSMGDSGTGSNTAPRGRGRGRATNATGRGRGRGQGRGGATNPSRGGPPSNAVDPSTFVTSLDIKAEVASGDFDFPGNSRDDQSMLVLNSIASGQSLFRQAQPVAGPSTFSESASTFNSAAMPITANTGFPISFTRRPLPTSPTRPKTRSVTATQLQAEHNNSDVDMDMGSASGYSCGCDE